MFLAFWVFDFLTSWAVDVLGVGVFVSCKRNKSLRKGNNIISYCCLLPPAETFAEGNCSHFGQKLSLISKLCWGCAAVAAYVFLL